MIRFCKKIEGGGCELRNENVIFHENMFSQVYKLLQENRCGTKVYVKVVDEKGKFLGYCYNDQSHKGAYIFYQETVNGLINSKLKKDVLLYRISSGEKKAINIFDMNELSLGLYKLCIKKGITVCIRGWGWNILDDNRSADELSVPDTEWFYVYAEGRHDISDKRKRNIYEEFLFLVKMGIGLGARRYLLAMIKECEEKGIHTITVSIPNKRQLTVLTEEQKICKEYPSFQEPIAVREKIYGRETAVFFKDGQCGTIDSTKDCYLFEGRTGVPVYQYQGETGKKRIYVIGPCMVFGHGCIATDTFPYQLQMLVREKDYTVVRVPFDNVTLPEKINICRELPVRERDILLFINSHHNFDEWGSTTTPVELAECRYIDTLKMYEAVAGKENWYGDAPAHTNAIGNKMLVKYIYEHGLKDVIDDVAELKTNHYLQKGCPIDKAVLDNVNQYILKLKKALHGVIADDFTGCIVMNANPFTLGHRYLIEKAADQVDKLIVFVVEEERSEFSFKDRLEMVKTGVSDLENVFIVPSGQFIISYKTLPVYFEKSELKNIRLNALTDLELFTRIIAPALGIRVRFAGEEPYDMVTKQYNEQMSEQLPEFGIMFNEIPRFVLNGETVSATKVRRYMEEGRWDKADAMLPESTRHYMKAENIWKKGKR